MPIPKSVEHKDLLAALKPLHDLLGTTANHIYASPPMVIGVDEITFCVVPDGTAVAEGYPEGVPFKHPQGTGELVCVISVQVANRG